jgi:D-alanyl-D-alanine carboxypeptidase-like protein
MPARRIALVCLAVLLGSACAAAGVQVPAPSPLSGVEVSPEPGSPSPVPAAPQGRTRFDGGVFPIGSGLRARLTGRNWRPGCPVPIDDLRLVRVSYWNFDGDVRTGPLVLHERVASNVLWVFRRLFRAGFPIEEIKLAAKDRPITPEDYWDRSRRSVTASFNCRPATGSTTTLSQHSYGWAIDINPLQNPYVRNDGSVLRFIAKPFRNRSRHVRGMIHDGDIVVRSFAAIGWEWGGHWHTLKDYMHFSLTGR